MAKVEGDDACFDVYELGPHEPGRGRGLARPARGGVASGGVACLNVDDGGGKVLIGTDIGDVEVWDLGEMSRLATVQLEAGPVKNIITRRAGPGGGSALDYGFFTEHEDDEERVTLTRGRTNKLCFVTRGLKKDCEVRHGLQECTCDYQTGRLAVFGVKGWEDGREGYKEGSEVKVRACYFA